MTDTIERTDQEARAAGQPKLWTPVGTSAYAEGVVPVTYRAVKSAEFTRPTNTDQYAAKDVVGPAVAAVMTFEDLAAVVGGGGIIDKVRLLTDQSANVAHYRLHLFHTTPTPIADNAPYTLLWANRANRIGAVDLPPAATEGTGSNAANSINDWVRLDFKCAADSRDIFGVLETLAVFTPASGQGFFVEVTAVSG